MIADHRELDVMRKRIEYFQNLLEQIRAQADPRDFESMASGYRLEIERMQAEIMDYLLHPPASVGEKQPA